MSMEAVMDEERKAVLSLLDSKNTRRSSSRASHGRSESPFSRSQLSPLASPMERLLDYDDLDAPPRDLVPVPAVAGSPRVSPRPAPAQPIRSMLDIGGPPPVPTTSKGSMLNIGGLPPTTYTPAFSAQSSPTEPNHRVYPPSNMHRHISASSAHPRAMSDSTARPADFGPYSGQSRGNPVAGYQFSDIITNRETVKPGKRSSLSSGSAAQGKRGTSMAEVMRGTDVSSLKLPGSLPLIRTAISGPTKSTSKSRSPHNRLGLRSKSPHVGLNARALSPAAAALVADSHNYDYSNAYKKLSDNRLMTSGGSLGNLAIQSQSREKTGSFVRLKKDYLGPNGEDLAEDSTDEHASSSDDEGERGRQKARSFTVATKSPSTSSSPVDTRKDDRMAHSLLAAAEEERIHVATSQPYRSLLEPQITVTNASGEKTKSSKQAVCPTNSFDSRAANDSDEEAQISAIKRAQNLTLTMTPIMSTPEVQRSIRIIYRGEFAKVQKKAIDDEHRRVRKYLVATDLSDESTHALEWAIGTVLRDGDTLVAIYCVDEEMGIPGSEEEAKLRESQAKAVSATAGVGKLPEPSTPTLVSATLAAVRGSDSARSASPAPGRDQSPAEEDRRRAVQSITDRIAKLLRKTHLEVRVIVEVLHCKTPRHLLTEVIDLIDPTMVILGSRGRSALKGVILGSFSNYLVTKSSVPVMVARKRLRKLGKLKSGSAPVAQVNNLNNPAARSLANAKID